MMWSSLLLSALCLPLASAIPGPPKYGGGGGGHGGDKPFFYKGFDLSSLKIMEDGGAVYKNAQQGNVTMPAEDILTGMNVVRLRLWVNPTVPFDDGYYETYDLDYVTALAKRFYAKGYKIYLDYRGFPKHSCTM